jgi:hypothetical protein
VKKPIHAIKPCAGDARRDPRFANTAYRCCCGAGAAAGVAGAAATAGAAPKNVPRVKKV